MATGLIVNVGADTTDFKTEIRELPKEFEKAEQEIEASAGRANTAIGGIFKGLMSAGTLLAIERTIAHFDKVADAASKYGATAEDIQRVGQAAEMTGSTIDTVAMAMERAGVAAAKAARGNEEFVEKFNRAGIDALAFSTADLTERVEMVARAQQEAGNSGDRHAAILEAVGDAAAGIDFQRIADEMGNVTVASDDTVKKLSQANDQINTAKNTLMIWGAEALGFFARINERLALTLSAIQDNPFSFTPDQRVGATIEELEDAERRLNAIALLRSRQGITNATEEQIQREIEAIKEREKLANRPPPPQDTNDDLNERNAKTEQSAQLKQRLLEISLQLKEAEVAQNTELAKQLRYQEDLYKGLIKYKDAEDAYGMAVRSANAELAKRNQGLKFADKGDGSFQESFEIDKETLAALQPKLDALEEFYAGRKKLIEQQFSGPEQTKQLMGLDNLYREAKADTLRGGNLLQTLNGASPQMMAQAAMTEPERQRAEAATRSATPGTATEADKIATETTLQKVAKFLEELNTKLPQPVLV